MVFSVGPWFRRGCGSAFMAVIALAFPATSRADASLSPFVDCVVSNNGSFTAWFGFSNTTLAPINIPVGSDNVVTPGITFQGQPTYFGVGTYRRVFSVQFGTPVTEVVWILDGLEAIATGNLPGCDDAVSAPASALTPTTATLNGVVTPNGEPTTYRFQWGTMTSYDRQSQPATVSGTAPQLVSDQLTDLQPGTTYHFRLRASNVDDGTTAGGDETFTTPAAPTPPVDLLLTMAASPATVTAGHALTYTLTATNTSTTAAASGVTVTDSLPGALANTKATSSQGNCTGSATVVCALGELAAGASSTVTIAGRAGGTAPLVNTASVSGQQPDPNTANNVATATTAVVAAPVVSTGPGIGAPGDNALVSGTVNPEGHATSFHFDYGTSTTYGHRTTSQNAGAGATVRFVTALLTRLQNGKTYHYRLVATNAAGTTRGADATFRTPPSPSYGTHGVPRIVLVADSRDCGAGPGYVAVAVLGGRLRELSAYLDGVLITRTTKRDLALTLPGGRQLTIVAIDGAGHDHQKSLRLKSCTGA